MAKALSLEVWSFADVEVLTTSAAPEVRLSGAAARRAAELDVQPSISLTHTETTAAAVAMAL